MKVRCKNGCFEREVPKHLEKKIKEDRGLICTFCWNNSIQIIKVKELQCPDCGSKMDLTSEGVWWCDTCGPLPIKKLTTWREKE